MAGPVEGRYTARDDGPVSLTPEQTERVVAIALDLAREGNSTELLEFVAHGLPVETRSTSGDTLLMLAAYHGHASTVAALLAAGADPDAMNERGQTPLAGALFKGAEDVVAVLREAGADLDAGTPSPRATAEMFGRSHLLEGAP